METRRLGTSDLQLTIIGLGTWAIGGGGWTHGWGPRDDADSIRTIHRAIDLGINWIDTAAVYGLGHAEEVVRQALQDRQGQVIVATKGGLRWRANGRIYPSLKAHSVRTEVENSLKRLGVETIDLYQVHWPFPERDVEQGWSTIGELVREGKIRYAGVSNFSVAQMRHAQAIHPITSLQPPYNMINRLLEDEHLPFCAEHGIGVLAYSPLQCGLLTGAFDADRLAQLDAGDWRRNDGSFQEPVFSKALELVRGLEPIARRSGHTVSELAIAWVLRRSELTAAIVGARKPSQIARTAPAADWQIAADDLQAIGSVLDDVNVPAPPSLR